MLEPYELFISINVSINLLQSGIYFANDYPDDTKQEITALINVFFINIFEVYENIFLPNTGITNPKTSEQSC